MIPDNVLQRTFCMQYRNETATCFTMDMYRKQYIEELKREAIIELKIPELEGAAAG